MAAPTADEILELYYDLNFPSASKLRAALLKKGFRARMQDVEQFVKAQTPTQLFAKGPKYRGHIISSRVNERWAIDFIDFQAEPDGNLKYMLMAQDLHSGKILAKALAENNQQTISERSRTSCERVGSPNKSMLVDNSTYHNSFGSYTRVMYSTASRGRRVEKIYGVLDASMGALKKDLKRTCKCKEQTGGESVWAMLCGV